VIDDDDWLQSNQHQHVMITQVTITEDCAIALAAIIQACVEVQALTRMWSNDEAVPVRLIKVVDAANTPADSW